MPICGIKSDDDQATTRVAARVACYRARSPVTRMQARHASEACKSRPYLLASRYWQAVSPCLPPATLLAPRNWPVACNLQRTYLHGCKLQGRYLPRSVVALTLAPSWTSLRMVRACTRSSQPTNRLSAPAAAKCCAAPSASVSVRLY